MHTTPECGFNEKMLGSVYYGPLRNHVFRFNLCFQIAVKTILLMDINFFYMFQIFTFLLNHLHFQMCSRVSIRGCVRLLVGKTRCFCPKLRQRRARPETGKYDYLSYIQIVVVQNYKLYLQYDSGCKYEQERIYSPNSAQLVSSFLWVNSLGDGRYC